MAASTPAPPVSRPVLVPAPVAVPRGAGGTARLQTRAAVAALGVHWPLLLVLAIGLVLRVPYVTHGHTGDLLNNSRVATTIFTWGQWLDLYHNGYIHAYPYAHPPLGPILYAPFNWLALTTGGSYTAAYHLLNYAFEAVATALLYVIAWGYAGSRQARLPALVAAAFFLATLSLLWLPERISPPESHFTSIATAFVLAALWRRERPAQAGVLLGLALATRTETALLALPWMLHYARHSWTDAARFTFRAGVTVGAICLPFFLRDPVAFDWAIRGHIAERLTTETPLLWRWLDVGGQGAVWLEAVRPYNSLVMAGALLAVAVLFARDPWLERALLLVGLTHALTMPVFHVRYVLYVLAIGLAYVARAGVPHLLTIWLLVTMRTDFGPATLGLPWLGLAWQSARAPGMTAADADPMKARIHRFRYTWPSLPLWAAPAALALIWAAAALPRVSADPLPSNAWGLHVLAHALRAPDMDGPTIATRLPGALVRVMPLGTPAWWANALPALAGVTLVAVSVVPALLWVRWRGRREAHLAAMVGGVLAIVLSGQAFGAGRQLAQGETYQSLAVLNLQELERDATICVERSVAPLWWYAQRVDGVRQDVSVTAGDGAACAARAAEAFGSRPVYVSTVTPEVRRAPLVFFPVRGVWRAVTRRADVREGAVLKGPDERVYLVQGGRRRWVPSLEAFGALGLSWEQVQLASYEDLAALPEGQPVGEPAGTLAPQ
ncbi:MAG: hypothetical protein AVDCRST_MAG77-2566 [uncultured Chloroflexi bacterium]|uniref:Uncharacterized protein n=1 Tax=uncultured Chloroflexota bacterium TaxID=166587 RepID=A0A6J4IPY5_9CHLR|nr:MAG: hypothetical protein AVDCRST_MAG77-2566 [uncultured Chloroflexota bacterium]